MDELRLLHKDGHTTVLSSLGRDVDINPTMEAVMP
jgi:hypothetical protein